LLDETKIKEEHKKDDKNSKISQVITNYQKEKSFLPFRFSNNNEGEEQHSKQKRNMTKIKCYICYKNGHFASQCPHMKKGKGKS